MRYISQIMVFFVLLLFNYSSVLSTQETQDRVFAQNEIEPNVINDCLEMAGASAHLMANCYLRVGQLYQEHAQKKYQELNRTIPDEHKPLLAKYHQAIADSVDACQLLYHASNAWQKREDTHQTLADVANHECFYETRKKEYETYVQLQCQSGDCW